ncbi:MAG: hypothetical protein K6G12_06285 [Lachnospiraceae bacterium]|nr:hypothetical protein [Lachnospiraceae bacterium]
MITNSYYKNASEVRKNWSLTIDSVVHDRPAFINRTHDYVAMLDSGMLAEILKDYKYHVSVDDESDGSITCYVAELELVENAPSKKECIAKIIDAMKDYALDYYKEFNYWSKAPNRSAQVPYILKLLVSTDDMIMEDIVCQSGRN